MANHSKVRSESEPTFLITERSTSPADASVRPEEIEEDRRTRGVTRRVVILSLLLAVMFGYLMPIMDYRFNNTFLGASHLPAGAIGVLLLLVLVVNPLLRLVSRKAALARNEALTVYITCLFSCL